MKRNAVPPSQGLLAVLVVSSNVNFVLAVIMAVTMQMKGHDLWSTFFAGWAGASLWLAVSFARKHNKNRKGNRT